jgi:hypothetical protein
VDLLHGKLLGRCRGHNNLNNRTIRNRQARYVNLPAVNRGLINAPYDHVRIIPKKSTASLKKPLSTKSSGNAADWLTPSFFGFCGPV